MRFPRHAAGFSAIELMVVVAIAAILAALAAPNMMSMVRNQRVKTASFDTFAALIYARSEAIKRNIPVTLAPAGPDWSSGWTTTDANGNVLARQDPFVGITVAGPATVTYNGMGRLAAAITPFSLTAPNIDSTYFRCVSVDLSGRPTSKQGAC